MAMRYTHGLQYLSSWDEDGIIMFGQVGPSHGCYNCLEADARRQLQGRAQYLLDAVAGNQM
jgi:hypothetical protein